MTFTPLSSALFSCWSAAGTRNPGLLGHATYLRYLAGVCIDTPYGANLGTGTYSRYSTLVSAPVPPMTLTGAGTHCQAELNGTVQPWKTSMSQGREHQGNRTCICSGIPGFRFCKPPSPPSLLTPQSTHPTVPLASFPTSIGLIAVHVSNVPCTQGRLALRSSHPRRGA